MNSSPAIVRVYTAPIQFVKFYNMKNYPWRLFKVAVVTVFIFSSDISEDEGRRSPHNVTFKNWKEKDD